MALVVGTNVGFVTEAPVGDPNGNATVDMDNQAIANKDTSSATAGKIIEIGWWCQDATEEANFEVAIYDHNSGNNLPGDIIGSDLTNAKGTTIGWKRVTGLNITITGNTIYWIAVQLDNTATVTEIDAQSALGRSSKDTTATTTLNNPWPSGAPAFTSMKAIYAVWEEAVGFTRKIKISGTFQDKPIKTKVGGTFEDKPIKIKVGGTFQDA